MPSVTDTAKSPLRASPLWASPLGCALIVLVLSVPRMILVGRYGLIGDEAYYAIWSLYPGFGYYDHPPGVAWTIWLGRTIFGESVFAVRSMFFVASLVTAAALYRIAVLLFDDRRIGAVAAIGYSATIGVLVTFAVATPDGPSTLFWTLSIWAVAEFTRSRNANWWLVAGAMAGLGLLSKYTVIFLAPGLLLYLLSSAERRSWLRLWQVWAGAAIAMAMFLPVVYVDSAREFASFRFQSGRSAFGRTPAPGEFVRFIIEEAIQLLPTLFIPAVVGIAAWFARRARELALLVLVSLPMTAYFLADAVFGRVNPNWTAPLFPMLSLLGAWTLLAVRPTRAWLRVPLTALGALHVPLGVGIMLTGLAALEYRALPIFGPLPLLNFVYGWDNLQRTLSSLARDKGAEWIDTSDYTLNGLLGYYTRIAGDPLPVVQTSEPIRSQYRPPMEPSLAAAPHLFVTYSRGGTQPARDGATPLGSVARAYGDETFDSYWVYLVH
jgi:4-amino-4-deoxy-L-arabinose transferase-like glycosyltransferase